jgi:hypothetical protein
VVRIEPAEYKIQFGFAPIIAFLRLGRSDEKEERQPGHLPGHMGRIKKYNYVWITLILFLASLIGHWLFAWYQYVDEQSMHGQPVQVNSYLIETANDTLENWQSEFLQLLLRRFDHLTVCWHMVLDMVNWPALLRSVSACRCGHTLLLVTLYHRGPARSNMRLTRRFFLPIHRYTASGRFAGEGIDRKGIITAELRRKLRTNIV